ncbi:hypothetical protein [Pseudomonas aeruginosa]|uniref:hypothetical protein n=1 Tax=Pseudomonas aeruginosa TaxID=287 RepID=UPI000AE96703
MAMHTELSIYKAASGLFRQASHSQVDRAALANVLLRRGRSINGALTKTYRKPTKEPAA